MCGIAGIISSGQSVNYKELLGRMMQSIAHRGPDGEGFWVNDKWTAGLAHRRLSIIDLSPEAAQPMHFASRYSITYNGEIYNYIELKEDLKKLGYQFKTTSDTEVILAAYDHYKEKCLRYLDGMFAFAIWDEKEQILFAARDRFGEKPFYFALEDKLFVFGSEMKALWAAGVPKMIEKKILLNYLTLGYVQNPSDKSQTFYSNISSLQPAHYLLLNAISFEMHVVNYWDIDRHKLTKMSEDDIMQQFNFLLRDSVQKRLRSVVPIGASLSGGLDSSTLTSCILQHVDPAKFHTFSAVFPGFEKDESVYIDEMVQRFGIQNHKVYPTADGLISDFEKIFYHQEEPFPSSSIYAQFKVFESAAAHKIPVLIDGQGADEVLGGYNKYLHWFLQELISRNKFSLAKKERDLFKQHRMDMFFGFKNILSAYLPSHTSIALEKREFHQIAHHPDISKEMLAVVKGREWDGIHKPIVNKLNDILYFNVMENGLEELLRFSDRNSMAHSVEVRLPFLSAELVQFVFSLPSTYKIRDGFTKFILRKTMQGKLPDNLLWRTDKIGYEPPQKQWMQNATLTEYVQESRRKLVNAGVLMPSVLLKKTNPLSAHVANNYDWRYLCAAQFL